MNVGGTCVSADAAAVSGAACMLPGVPTGLTKTVGAPTPGSGKVLLTWTAATNADSYEILRSTSSGSGYAAFSNNTVSGTSLTDSSPINDTSYYYVVNARNGGANCASANSAEIKAIPRACQILPGSAQNFTLGVTGPTCFVICWDLATNNWNYWNLDGRSMTINGRSVSSSGADPGAKSNGAYTFSFTAGTYSSAGGGWWGSTGAAHDCE